ncbi:hypothetical protein [Kitasatospora sp. NPDC002040]|uniref:hypothetical protein n=1 Tax=Kitasatospora sp. NPDC002040 TaxID=3154661 RepID=UPI00331FFCC7
MVTHGEEMYVTTTVFVTPCEQGSGAWEVCPNLPEGLDTTLIRACEDLPAVLETQGGVIAAVLRHVVRYRGFRLLARETRTHALAGGVEWVHDRATGTWRMHDQPWTTCDYGLHDPAALEVAA